MEKIYTKNAPEAIGPYSQGIVHNNILYTSGQIAIDPKTGNVEDTTIIGQTRQVIENLGAVLNKAGSNFEKVIKTTCFLKDMEDFLEFNKVYAKYFTEKPARSCVAVKELPKNVLVEIEIIAAL